MGQRKCLRRILELNMCAFVWGKGGRGGGGGGGVAFSPGAQDILICAHNHIILTYVLAESKICFTTFEEAELGKMIHNAFNAAKISFFNQAWRLASAVSAASRTPVSMDVIQQFLPSSCEGLWNPKYGTVSGAPYGGHCLPKDSQAMAFLESALLTDIADRQKSCPQLFKAVVEVNEAMGRSADGHTTTKALVAPAFPAHVDTSKYDMMPSKGLSTDHNLLEICAGLHLL